MADDDAEGIDPKLPFRPLAAILPRVLGALEGLVQRSRWHRALAPDDTLREDCRWYLEVLAQAVEELQSRANPDDCQHRSTPFEVKKLAEWTAVALAAGDDWEPGRDIEQLEAWRENLR